MNVKALAKRLVALTMAVALVLGTINVPALAALYADDAPTWSVSDVYMGEDAATEYVGEEHEEAPIEYEKNDEAGDITALLPAKK